MSLTEEQRAKQITRLLNTVARIDNEIAGYEIDVSMGTAAWRQGMIRLRERERAEAMSMLAELDPTMQPAR